MDFPSKLQTLRKEHALSQEKLAERLDVSRQAVSKWEAGQSYPELEKILQLCELFGVSADYILRDGPQNPAQARSAEGERPARNRWAAASAVLGVLLLIGVAAVVLLTLQSRGADAEAPAAYEGLAQYYFDFSRESRLDYVPYFTEGGAPTESPEYLFWAFAVNLGNWGEDKGIMTKTYVEETVAAHFGVAGLSHLPMRKAWEYDGERYTALPQGIAEPPIYLLKAYSTYLRNGVQVHEVVLDGCIPADGMIPTEEETQKIRSSAENGPAAGLTVVQTEKLSYYESFDGPVFLSHELLSGEDK